jgi:cytoskeletal protein CcmA (bactofilin family)
MLTPRLGRGERRRGRAVRRFALCRYYRPDTHLEGASFEQAAEEPAAANGFREPRMQRIPRVDDDFHVNKIPIVAVAEGRGAQDMVALVPVEESADWRIVSSYRRKQEVDMLTSTKSGAPEKDRNASVGAAEVIGRVVQHDQLARSGPTSKAGMASCIGSDMSIVGNIECNGPAQVFGRIEGEVRASDLQISEGAQVEGSVIAQNVTVCGRVKGTIRAVRVKLQSGGAVEGDIFHRSLSIDENSQFEGSSRRVENPTDPSSSVDAKGPQKKGTPPASLPSINAELADGLKH